MTPNVSRIEVRYQAAVRLHARMHFLLLLFFSIICCAVVVGVGTATSALPNEEQKSAGRQEQDDNTGVVAQCERRVSRAARCEKRMQETYA